MHQKENGSKGTSKEKQQLQYSSGDQYELSQQQHMQLREEQNGSNQNGSMMHKKKPPVHNQKKQ